MRCPGLCPQAAEQGSPEEICDLVTQLLADKGPMLQEYLGMGVDEQVRGPCMTLTHLL